MIVWMIRDDNFTLLGGTNGKCFEIAFDSERAAMDYIQEFGKPTWQARMVSVFSQQDVKDIRDRAASFLGVRPRYPER